MIIQLVEKLNCKLNIILACSIEQLTHQFLVIPAGQDGQKYFNLKVIESLHFYIDYT